MSGRFLTPASNERSKLYKGVGRAEDNRRRRMETSVELRKQKQNDEMMKRRNLTIEIDDTEDDGDLVNTTQESGGTKKQQLPIPSVEELMVVFLSPGITLDQLQQAYEGVRRLLSRSNDPPIQQVIDAGLLKVLVEGLQLPDDKIRFEAAWSLTNIVSGTSEQTRMVVEAGAIAPLMQLCNSESAGLAEQALWAIANVVGDSVENRDHALAIGIVPTLCKLISVIDSLSVSFVRTIAWTFSNLCRYKRPQVSLDVLGALLPGIATLLKHNDTTVRVDACWALAFATDGTDEAMQLALNSGAIPYVVTFLKSKHTVLISPALRVLGNLSTGNDVITQAVLDHGVLSVIPSIFDLKDGIKKECCWLLSNVLAGTISQIQQALDAHMLPLLILALKNGDHRSQYETSWALSNLVHGGSATQILEITRLGGAAEAMCGALKAKSNEVVANVLDTLRGVLETVYNCEPENLNKLRDQIEEADGLDHLEALQHSDSERLYELAYSIVDRFFNEVNEDGDENGNESVSATDLMSNSVKFEF